MTSSNDPLGAFIAAERAMAAEDATPDGALEARILRALESLPPQIGGVGAGTGTLSGAKVGLGVLAAAGIIIALVVYSMPERPSSVASQPAAKSPSLMTATSLAENTDSASSQRFDAQQVADEPSEKTEVSARPQQEAPSPPTNLNAMKKLPQAPAAQIASADSSHDDASGDIAAYDVARDLMKRGYFVEASDAFTAFLHEHPRSLLVAEAHVSLVEATFRAGRFDEVIRRVDDALAGDSLLLRRGDLMRVKADALAKTKKCDAAAAAFTDAIALGARQLTSTDLDAALAACRRQ